MFVRQPSLVSAVPDQIIQNIRGDLPRLMASEQIANCGILVRVQVLALESHP
jgi:hypothetical protein